jgi:hypothetical protein
MTPSEFYAYYRERLRAGRPVYVGITDTNHRGSVSDVISFADSAEEIRRKCPRTRRNIWRVYDLLPLTYAGQTHIQVRLPSPDCDAFHLERYTRAIL